MALIDLEAYRHDVLQLGAVGRLMMTGELAEVLPLDDEATLGA